MKTIQTKLPSGKLFKAQILTKQGWLDMYEDFPKNTKPMVYSSKEEAFRQSHRKVANPRAHHFIRIVTPSNHKIIIPASTHMHF